MGRIRSGVRPKSSSYRRTPGTYRNYAVPDDGIEPPPADIDALITAFADREHKLRLEYPLTVFSIMSEPSYAHRRPFVWYPLQGQRHAINREDHNVSLGAPMHCLCGAVHPRSPNGKMEHCGLPARDGDGVMVEVRCRLLQAGAGRVLRHRGNDPVGSLGTHPCDCNPLWHPRSPVVRWRCHYGASYPSARGANRGIFDRGDTADQEQAGDLPTAHDQ